MVNMFISGISTGAFSFVNLLDKKKTTIGNLVDIHFICKLFLVLSSFLTYHRVNDYGSTTGTTNGAGTAYPSGK
jgi:hypothetical protein